MNQIPPNSSLFLDLARARGPGDTAAPSKFIYPCSRNRYCAELDVLSRLIVPNATLQGKLKDALSGEQIPHLLSKAPSEFDTVDERSMADALLRAVALSLSNGSTRGFTQEQVKELKSSKLSFANYKKLINYLLSEVCSQEKPLIVDYYSKQEIAKFIAALNVPEYKSIARILIGLYRPEIVDKERPKLCGNRVNIKMLASHLQTNPPPHENVVRLISETAKWDIDQALILVKSLCLAGYKEVAVRDLNEALVGKIAQEPIAQFTQGLKEWHDLIGACMTRESAVDRAENSNEQLGSSEDSPGSEFYGEVYQNSSYDPRTNARKVHLPIDFEPVSRNLAVPNNANPPADEFLDKGFAERVKWGRSNGLYPAQEGSDSMGWREPDDYTGF